MKTFALLIAIGVLSVATPSLHARQKDGEADADAKQFQAALNKFATRLQAAPAYSLEIHADWKIVSEDKKREKEGRNRFKLVREKGNRLRIEANPGDQLQPTLVAASDGKELTVYLRPSGIFERKSTPDPAADVLHSQFLTTSVRGTGIDLLLMKDWPSFLEKTIRELDYAGKEKVDGMELDHYEMLWGNDRVEMWFQKGFEPVLQQYRRTVTVPVHEKTSVKVVTTAKLICKMERSFGPATFQLEIPASARQVGDIYTALIKGEKAVVLGKPTPGLHFKLLDGKPLDLTEHSSRKEPVALLFFAAWSVPGADHLDALAKLIQEFRRKGIAFYGVDVGDSKDDAETLVRSQKLDIPVALDPKGTSTDDFSINALPAVVLIGKDGTVQAVLQDRGTNKDLIQQLRRDLDRLNKGESLIPSGK